MEIRDKIIRSATFEGTADSVGNPTSDYVGLYENLAKNGVKNIITGFMFIANEGRAMQKGQAGMDSTDKAEKFKIVTDVVHKYGAKIYAQLAHTGRQTTGTGYDIVWASDKKSCYFGETPRTLTTSEVYEIAGQFAAAAFTAKEAGFDGVQLHAAHGYLIHQFLLKTINDRTDEFAEPTYFLEVVIDKVREKCGDFPLWVKVSGNVDIGNDDGFIGTIKFLDKQRVDLIEVSYGTMDYALNIFRGSSMPLKAALKHNPIITKKNWLQIIKIALKTKRYSPVYNLKYAKIAKKYTDIPVSVVGGFRTAEDVKNCETDYVSLCRPFICEPDLLRNSDFKSKCTNCNLCAIMADSSNSKLRCYKNGR